MANKSVFLQANCDMTYYTIRNTIWLKSDLSFKKLWISHE
jgi:hypothetical protein